MSRSHLKNVWLSAFGRRTNTRSDENEALPYRVAVLGFIVGMLLIILFNTVFLKVGLLYTVAFFVFSLALFLTFARARVQLGLPTVQTNSSRYDQRFLVPVFGSKTLGMSLINGSGFNYSLIVGYVGSGMAGMFESLRMAEKVGMSKRSMSKALMFAVVLSILLSFVIGLPFIYEYGYNKAQIVHDAARGFGDISSQMFPRTLPEGRPPFDPDLRDVRIPVQIIALLLTGFLAYMHSTFIWWQLHPLGYVIGVSEVASGIWSGFFIAWLAKKLIMRYGGAGLFDRVRPLFMGFIVGTALRAVLVGLLGLIPGFFATAVVL